MPDETEHFGELRAALSKITTPFPDRRGRFEVLIYGRKPIFSGDREGLCRLGIVILSYGLGAKVDPQS
ncbi:MAG TPA: hypothetical protein VGS10_20705, partial [Terracidiphilus sp.]|nr:hypothetical protein [Terracidiphilus sp.]